MKEREKVISISRIHQLAWLGVQKMIEQAQQEAELWLREVEKQHGVTIARTLSDCKPGNYKFNPATMVLELIEGGGDEKAGSDLPAVERVQPDPAAGERACEAAERAE